MNKEKNSLDFVRGRWNARLETFEDGYSNSLLYVFSRLHSSGNDQLVKLPTIER